MRKSPHRLLRNARGAAMIEFAIALPVLIVLIYGIFLFGLVFQANAGMQHGLGEGARMATLHPTPSVTDIRAKIQEKVFGTGAGSFTVAEPVVDNESITLSVTYSMPLNFIFFEAPPIGLTRTKKVYTAAGG